MVYACACNSTAWKAAAGGWQVRDQCGFYNEIMTQNNETEKCQEWMGAYQEIHAGKRDRRDEAPSNKAHTLVLLRHVQTLSTLVARTQRRTSLVMSGV